MTWRLRSRTLSTADHTLIMGILNVTPDSFSDGGVNNDDAVEHGLALWEAGADLVDVGGESTRPGSTGVDASVELGRVVPVVSALAAAGVVVSVDTRKPAVAGAAIAAGAEAINDITAFADPAMAAVCEEGEVGVVLMHMQGTPETMQDDPRYDDVVGEVGAELLAAAAGAEAAGIATDRICIDPGFGFGKTHDHNLALLANLETFTSTGYPVLVGTSRKGFLGRILEGAGHPEPAPGRDPATGATIALAIAAGAAVVRVHDVASALQVARTADAVVRAR